MTRSLLLAALLAALAVPARAELIYVSNEKDDTISVIDGDSLEVVRTFPVGQRPRGITFSKDFRTLYVCASDSDTVQVIDVATDAVLHELPSGEDPEQFALHPDGNHLYIANEDDAVATIVDVQSRTVVAQVDVGVEPEGMAVSHDGKWAIVTSETTNMAHWIDTASRALVDNTLVEQRPRDAVFTEDDGELWVSSEIGGTVAVIDVASRQVKHTITFTIPGVSRDRIQPVGLELPKGSRYGFVALGPANHVAVIDRQDGYKVVDYILVGRRVWHMALSTDGSRLFTSNGVSGDVTVVDTASFKPLKTIKVGRYPWGLAVLPSQAVPR